MKITDKNIFVEAEKGNLDILKHPSVDKVVDKDEETPLHVLAWQEKIEVLNHPSVDKVVDNNGETPLHVLASKGKVQVLDHPSVDKVVDLNGDTPLHVLASKGKVPRKWIVEKYPWFELGDRNITVEIVTEILNTSYAERFILSQK